MWPSPTGSWRRSAATWPRWRGTRRWAWTTSCAAIPTASGVSARTPRPRPGAGGLAGPGHLAFGVALGDRLALVVGALAPGQAQLDLDQLVLEVDAQRDQGQAALVDPGRQLLDLLAVEQQLARPGRLVALVAGMGVGRDLHVQDDVAAVDHGVGVLERRLALAQGLDLAAAQDDPGLEGLEDLVVVAGTAVGDDRARGLAPGHPTDLRPRSGRTCAAPAGWPGPRRPPRGPAARCRRSRTRASRPRAGSGRSTPGCAPGPGRTCPTGAARRRSWCRAARPPRPRPGTAAGCRCWRPRPAS